ncbi:MULTISPECIES: isocitrate lyase/phosphoenolpyruvate mutase family protein [Micromonospora]|uniref:Isocitrate lyase/phosphoenolpyruvate mutase family protein n=1 Tax=Micromonospora solifontis TaxID=2487138 RepID=A0ABX9WA56_9ACTN|nr:MULTISPECIES: isocitrate lyase/phosphoenolpyruvate mutase family protein [Micromonospora]NES17150.1 isocitrate lyase/phosphoenolpyruvate mutase family protein [Micromonospora sp. PPF5-17B]NES39091.1 isocitrate lyase/phosphoenolpyruvate mutase family protein [Micromonospora solifontis]NES58837.1 isocitrate lyase/phosphoenolpyruvate mutase family protein [Micromonospora sp. PPF5-6]RNL91100.1 isocitrate lyase/phosphoenolpyruvate mutase family protein [Micromonospora solifontis]
MTELSRRADALRALHRPGDPLILPNAWDPGSARAVVAAGFPAIATSSGAVAEALGHADNEATPVAEMVAAVGRIAAAVAVPVTADLERGYGLRPAELVERLLAAGAVGCNIEDSDPRTRVLVDVEEQADLLAGIRAAARAAGVELVLNARVDVHLRAYGPAEERLAEAVSRARRYLAAGADSVYPIILADPADIRSFVAEVDAPVNIMARPGAPAPVELAALGVARVSYGSGVYAAARARTVELLAAIRAGDDPFVC